VGYRRRTSGFVASIFFAFFKVFFAILFLPALFALLGIAGSMCNSAAKAPGREGALNVEFTVLHSR
jgi:hypothetical protein